MGVELVRMNKAYFVLVGWSGAAAGNPDEDGV